uniref:Beta/gamma crystallin 'Greek key' domain-containing protein n=1 Tax=Astyanax mexicanus TaxID=7994 RepID=A0A8B9J4Z3_ASTMX
MNIVLQIMLFDQENFQGRMMEVQNECMNVCDQRYFIKINLLKWF